VLDTLDGIGSVTFQDFGESGINFVNKTLAVLDKAFQASQRQGPVVVAIGQAQSRLFGMLQQGKMGIGGNWDLETRNRRRKVTVAWLNALDLSVRRAASEPSHCWELLVGGTIPLLLQHASDEGKADAMEFGRLALSALLPLTDRDMAIEVRNQVASVVALINLLFAAYPVMPHHGGKILCHLLASASAAVPASPTHKLFLHAAATALVICGPKFAGETVESILLNHHCYQEILVTTAIQVSAMAEEMKNKT
jgi:hypothetical protein